MSGIFLDGLETPPVEFNLGIEAAPHGTPTGVLDGLEHMLQARHRCLASGSRARDALAVAPHTLMDTRYIVNRSIDESRRAWVGGPAEYLRLLRSGGPHV